MRFIRGFIGFWIDFIVGDAWEVAVGLAIALVVIAYSADHWGDREAFGFALVATIVGVTWLALARTTASARGAARASSVAAPAPTDD